MGGHAVPLNGGDPRLKAHDFRQNSPKPANSANPDPTEVIWRQAARDPRLNAEHVCWPIRLLACPIEFGVRLG